MSQIIFNEEVAPSTPAAGKVSVYAKSDGLIYGKDDAGIETALSNIGSGTVTSVAVSGGTTGLTTSGGPITTSGTITLTGTLEDQNGGTGFSTYTTGDTLYSSASNVLSKLAVGTSGQVLTVAAGIPSWATPSSGGFTSGTAASATGTSIDFTGLPSTAKVIFINFSGVSTNGTSIPIIQIGDSGGFEITGYNSGASNLTSAITSVNSTVGFAILGAVGATTVVHGVLILTLLDSATNLWAFTGTLGLSNAAGTSTSGGSKSLSATLDRIRITTTNGTDAYDAGTINISYQ